MIKPLVGENVSSERHGSVRSVSASKTNQRAPFDHMGGV